MMDLITMFLYVELTKWWWYFKYEIIQLIPIGTNTKKGAKGAIVLSKDCILHTTPKHGIHDYVFTLGM